MKTTFELCQLIELERNVKTIHKCALEVYKILELPMPEGQGMEMSFPFMSKSEFAAVSGIKPRTLRRNLRQHQEELMRMGIPKTAKVLTPEGVKFLCELLCVDISAFQKNG